MDKLMRKCVRLTIEKNLLHRNGKTEIIHKHFQIWLESSIPICVSIDLPSADYNIRNRIVKSSR